MQFAVNPSPSPEVYLSRYDSDQYPKFEQVIGSSHGGLAFDPEEAHYAMVLENRSARSIIALQYGWRLKREGGPERRSIVTSREKIKPGARHLLGSSGTFAEGLLDEGEPRSAYGWGGGSAGRSCELFLDDQAKITFALDVMIFADGEVTGLDPDNYVEELECHELAFQFVARQVRLAEKENRDVTPVLSALKQMPLSIAKADPCAHTIQFLAAHFLAAGVREPIIRGLKEADVLPKFYRRDGSLVPSLRDMFLDQGWD
ncbi:MAG TPA: hypothetical protein VF783_11795 [Terriglobales bacterium]